MSRENSSGMKVVGGRNLPSYWEQFDRLHRTSKKLRGGLGMPRGIFRFQRFETFEEWKWNQQLNSPDNPSAPT